MATIARDGPGHVCEACRDPRAAARVLAEVTQSPTREIETFLRGLEAYLEAPGEPSRAAVRAR